MTQKRVITQICVASVLVAWTCWCVWAIDVSTIAMSNGWDLTNGFRYDSAVRIYHVALYSLYAISLFWVLLLASTIKIRK